MFQQNDCSCLILDVVNIPNIGLSFNISLSIYFTLRYVNKNDSHLVVVDSNTLQTENHSLR
jgi:hypothetical protein